MKEKDGKIIRKLAKKFESINLYFSKRKFRKRSNQMNVSLSVVQMVAFMLFIIMVKSEKFIGYDSILI